MLYLCPVVQQLEIQSILAEQEVSTQPILDVRSPKEFAKGHIPGALSLPLFMDDERALVGTMYKQVGHDKAVRKGLEIIGPKMSPLVDQAEKLCPGKKAYLHCWRGGMRSESVAWLLRIAGFSIQVIEGGYKSYRTQVLTDFAKPWKIKILGGKTGSGKTDILKALAARGEQIIDLEGIANHKGSTFGALMQPDQPSVEQFENNLHRALMQLDPSQYIWVEDESNAIGRVYVPQPFWVQMLAASVWEVEVPTPDRVKRLVHEYAAAKDTELKDAITRIKKRLGGQHYNRCMAAIEAGDYATTAEICLKYYDKAYQYGLDKKVGVIQKIEVPADDPGATADRLLTAQKSNK